VGYVAPQIGREEILEDGVGPDQGGSLQLLSLLSDTEAGNHGRS
jgi:hypothetical protein